MDKINDVLIKFLGFIKDIATNISETFTNSSSSAIFVMLIFYLVILILTILLLKLLVKVIKNLFRSYPSSKKRVGKKGSTTTPAPETPSSVDNATKTENKVVSKKNDTLLFLESFDKQPHLDKLSVVFNVVSNLDKNLKDHQPISQPDLQPLEDNALSDIHLSSDEKENINKKIENKQLDELKEILSAAQDEKANLDNKIDSLTKKLSEIRENRESIVENELTALNTYNSTIGEFEVLTEELEKNRVAATSDYFELVSFLNDIENKQVLLFETIKEIEEKISSATEKVDSFCSSYKGKIDIIVADCDKKEKSLNSLKTGYLTILDSRTKSDEEFTGTQNELLKVAKDKAFNDEFISVLSPKIEELTEIENARLKQLESERQAKLEAERIEAEKREAERQERERLAKIEQERQEKEQREKELQEKALAERLAQEEKAKAEASHVEEQEVPDASDNLDLNKVKEQVKQQSQNSYALNFDNIPPEMMEKMVRANQKRKQDAQKAVKPSGQAVEQSSSETEQQTDVSDENVDDVEVKVPENEETVVEEATASEIVTEPDVEVTPESESEPEPEKDYISELKQEWAAEREHKKQWAEEQAQRKEAEMRRKQELSKKLSEESASNDN